MDPGTSPTLIAAIVGVVLGGLGLVGGLVGYVQGAAALRRSTLARQRAASAEESALQAKTQADASARAAERALDRLRDMGVDPELLHTGPVRMQRVPDQVVDETDRVDPTPEAPDPPEAAAAPIGEVDPAPVPDVHHARPPRLESVPAAPAPAADVAPPSDPGEVAPNARTPGGQVVAGDREAPPLDWDEALRSGTVPMPTRSRGTYSAPKRAQPAAGTAPARFEMRAVGRQRWEAVNVGDTEAAAATVEGLGDDRNLVRPATRVPAPVAPGAVLALSAPRVDGRQLQVRVRWTADGETALQDLLLT